MAVEKDVVNVRVIILSTVISAILTVVTVWLVCGWFDRYEQEKITREADFDQSVARQLEKTQRERLTTESGGAEWADRQAKKARLPLDAAMDLAVKTEEERRKK